MSRANPDATQPGELDIGAAYLDHLGMRSDLMKGHLDGLVLSIVARGPAHGYAIIDSLRTESAGTFDLPEGTVYPALHRLERDGLLSSKTELFNGRERRVYRITGRGARSLADRRVEWREFAGAVDAVLATAWTDRWAAI